MEPVSSKKYLLEKYNLSHKCFAINLRNVACDVPARSYFPYFVNNSSQLGHFDFY